MKLHLQGHLEEVQEGLAIYKEYNLIELDENGLNVELFFEPESEKTKITYDGEKGQIHYTTRNNFFRLLNLFTLYAQEEESFTLEEEAYFDMLGVMPDMSRNAVLTVDGVKEMLIQQAKAGLDMAMLYTEDTYEIEEYPYFGYLRGRYSKEEMKELDDFAYALGIEMIPNIQTLGHLYNVLKYKEFSAIKDTSEVLLVGEEKTYEFLDNAIREASEPFRSNRIHIGMDEAWGLGRGVYEQKNGIRNSFDIMNEHLAEVVKITEKYGLEPMMWSDMYYRFGSETGDYYDLKSSIPQDVIDEIPEVEMVYWDYYHEDKEVYDTIFQNHLKMNKKVVFAGGAWTWNGISPNYGKAFETTLAAVESAKENDIREAIITLWLDDGGETPLATALPVMYLYAHLSNRESYDKEVLAKEFKHSTGYDLDEFLLLNDLDETPGVTENNLGTSAGSKVLLWQDPLLGLFDKTVEGLNLNEHYKELAEKLEKVRADERDYQEVFDFYTDLAKTLSLKAEFGNQVKMAYDKNDEEALKDLLSQAKEIKELVAQTRKSHRTVWFKYNKSFGWEVLDIRYGGVLARMETTIERMNAYLAGDLTTLEELEEEKLPYSAPYDLGEGVLGRGLYKDMVTPGKLSGV